MANSWWSHLLKPATYQYADQYAAMIEIMVHQLQQHSFRNYAKFI